MDERYVGFGRIEAEITGASLTASTTTVPDTVCVSEEAVIVAVNVATPLKLSDGANVGKLGASVVVWLNVPSSEAKTMVTTTEESRLVSRPESETGWSSNVVNDVWPISNGMVTSESTPQLPFRRARAVAATRYDGESAGLMPAPVVMTNSLVPMDGEFEPTAETVMTRRVDELHEKVHVASEPVTVTPEVMVGSLVASEKPTVILSPTSNAEVPSSAPEASALRTVSSVAMWSMTK